MLKNGIDLVEIERVRQSCENPTFVNRVFGEKERAQFSAQPQNIWQAHSRQKRRFPKPSVREFAAFRFAKSRFCTIHSARRILRFRGRQKRLPTRRIWNSR